MSIYPKPVPKVMLRAFRALLGMYGEPDFVKRWGCYHKKDVILRTGQPCDERKLRELSELDRDIVHREDWKIEGRCFRVYWLNNHYPSPAIGRDLDADGKKNPPAVAPHDVRLIPRTVPSSTGMLFDVSGLGRPE